MDRHSCCQPVTSAGYFAAPPLPPTATPWWPWASGCPHSCAPPMSFNPPPYQPDQASPSFSQSQSPPQAPSTALNPNSQAAPPPSPQAQPPQSSPAAPPPSFAHFQPPPGAGFSPVPPYHYAHHPHPCCPCSHLTPPPPPPSCCRHPVHCHAPIHPPCCCCCLFAPSPPPCCPAAAWANPCIFHHVPAAACLRPLPPPIFCCSSYACPAMGPHPQACAASSGPAPMWHHSAAASSLQGPRCCQQSQGPVGLNFTYAASANEQWPAGGQWEAGEAAAWQHGDPWGGQREGHGGDSWQPPAEAPSCARQEGQESPAADAEGGGAEQGEGPEAEWQEEGNLWEEPGEEGQVEGAEEEEAGDLVMTDEWLEFFAQSEAKRQEKKRQRRRQAKLARQAAQGLASTSTWEQGTGVLQEMKGGSQDGVGSAIARGLAYGGSAASNPAVGEPRSEPFSIGSSNELPGGEGQSVCPAAVLVHPSVGLGTETGRRSQLDHT